MDGHTISHAAEQTGFAASALRFYEDAGLVVPARTASGYRAYSDDDLDRLAFVARAKGFGLSLDEIAELLDLLDEDRCEPVQDRLRALIDTKLTHAQATIAELEAFAAELLAHAPIPSPPVVELRQLVLHGDGSQPAHECVGDVDDCHELANEDRRERRPAVDALCS